MTIDNEQIQALRAAAESCGKQEPLSLVVYHGKMCLRNKGGIVFTVLRDICFPEYSAENENYARLAELCTSDSILSLLADRDADKALIAELEKKHCGGSLMEREEHHVGVVNKLLERITELEARTLTVKLPRDITHVTNKYFEEGRDAVLEVIESQLAAAGITLDVGE